MLGVCQLPGGVARCTSCFCGQSLFALASAGSLRALAPQNVGAFISPSSPDPLCLRAWGSSSLGFQDVWERKIGDWGEEGVLDTTRLWGVDLERGKGHREWKKL